jgi:hypothetical protein
MAQTLPTMASGKKTWVEKRATGEVLRIERVEKKFGDIPAGATMLIATPREVEKYVKQIPHGHGTSLAQMRKDLAAMHGAQFTCPVTAGIFLRIIAEAAWEEMQAGKKATEVAPFWRIISTHSPTARKLSFGTDFLSQKLKEEGIADKPPRP